MDKYQGALIELARHTKQLRHINEQICSSLRESHVDAEKKFDKDYSGWPITPPEWAELGGKNLWLHRAYKIEREHYGSGMYDDYHAYHDDDVEGYLSENCQHALKAHQLIQERKEVKKALGVAKRRVTFLANRLLAAESI